MNGSPVAFIETAWRAVAGGAALPAAVDVVGDAGALPARLPVEDVAIACVASALTAAAALQQARGGRAPSTITLDRNEVAASVRSERYFRVDGAASGLGFAPLSRFWPTADGWLRTHANYPWHHAALLRALGLAADAGDDVDAVGAALASAPAAELEDAIVGAGGLAAAVRSLAQWQAHPQGRAVAAEPLVARERLGDSPASVRPAGPLPASGVRVLDLTRVIAGPVATRYLGALGAEVLRIDPPHRLDLPLGTLSETLLAKRSSLLDLGTPSSLATFHELLANADVVVHGYRGGALARFGLAPEDLAQRHPHLVCVSHDAWGHTGPWAQRRGFDSIVQAASGIATIESPDGAQPGVLPCQLLDHGTGYLVAAAALDGLRARIEEGGTQVRTLSLARTAAWLTAGAPLEHIPDAQAGADATVDITSGDGTRAVTVVVAPGALDGAPVTWPGMPARYGVDDPAWSPV